MSSRNLDIVFYPSLPKNGSLSFQIILPPTSTRNCYVAVVASPARSFFTSETVFTNEFPFNILDWWYLRKVIESINFSDTPEDIFIRFCHLFDSFSALCYIGSLNWNCNLLVAYGDWKMVWMKIWSCLVH